MKTESALRLLPGQTMNVVHNYPTHSGDQLTRTKDKLTHHFAHNTINSQQIQKQQQK